MMRNLFGSAAALVLGLSAAFAADLPFGGDTLPFAAAKARLVVKSSSGVPLDSPSPRVSLYRVEAVAFSEGSGFSTETKSYTVVIPKGVDVAEPAAFINSLVFLDGPLPADRRASYDIADNGDVYEVVSGRYGIISAETPALVAEIKSYLEASPAQRLEWAAKNVENANLYLQRSSVAEVRVQKDNPAVEGVLERALESKNVAPTTKFDALGAAQFTEPEMAVSLIEKAARTAENPESVRVSAVKSLNSLPGGNQVVQELRSANDPVVVAEANKVLAAQNAPPVIGVEGVNGSISEKLRKLRNLSKEGTAQAADKLKEVALDQKQEPIVRSNAIIGLTEFETGISQPALRDVSEKLPPSALKDTATSLANPF